MLADWIQVGDRCQFKGCRKMARRLVVDRSNYHRRVKKYCKDCVEMVAQHTGPECVVDCPNCGYSIPVN